MANNLSTNIPNWINLQPPQDGYVYANAEANHGNTVFGVPPAQANNARGLGAGWVKKRVGTGGVASFNVTAAGSGYVNGMSVVVQNGVSNAYGSIITNETGNVTGVTVTQVGYGWVSAAQANVNTLAEKSMVNITVGGTPTGYNNTDIITASNGTLDATATVATNSTGGFVTANVTITFPGIWANNKNNTHVSFAVSNSTGGASGGSGATFTANIAAGSNFAANVNLGGRAGRVTFEILDSSTSITANGDGSEFNNL